MTGRHRGENHAAGVGGLTAQLPSAGPWLRCALALVLGQGSRLGMKQQVPECPQEVKTEALYT